MVTDYRSRLGISDEALEAFCRKWKIAQLELFGSALRDDFTDASDIDMLVTFAPDAEWSLFNHVEMEDEIRALVGRKIDMPTRRAVERSENWIRRKDILDSARTIFPA